MKIKNLKGKLVDWKIHKYLIDWDGKERSKIQFKTKKFLQKYWKNHVVCSEITLPNSRLSLDMFNVQLHIAVEVQGKQHGEYNKFFHNGSVAAYRDQLRRDEDKYKFCEINNIQLIEIMEDEIDLLSKEWFEERFGITL